MSDFEHGPGEGGPVLSRVNADERYEYRPNCKCGFGTDEAWITDKEAAWRSLIDHTAPYVRQAIAQLRQV